MKELKEALGKIFADKRAIKEWIESGAKHEGKEWEEIQRRQIKFVNPILD